LSIISSSTGCFLPEEDREERCDVVQLNNPSFNNIFLLGKERRWGVEVRTCYLMVVSESKSMAHRHMTHGNPKPERSAPPNKK
jgi:hypothetical protein